jgi:diguanylate cyclase (GGDEF)-like protein
MNPETPYRRQAVPPRALVLSAGALLVPLLASTMPHPELEDLALLLWLLALVPPFLLAYYRGWRGAAVALAAGMAVLALTQALQNAVGGEVPDPWLLFVAICGYIGVSLGIGWVSELLHQARASAEQMALVDALTQLPNRRHFRAVLEHRFELARRGEPLAVVFFDLDHFKAYNDAHGHRAGDAAIANFARVLKQSTRAGDMPARYGGEEFVLILGAEDDRATTVVVERVMRGLLHSQAGTPAPVTVSAGVAFYGPEMQTLDDLLDAADRALYAAKADGRNCCRRHAPETRKVSA